MDGLGTEGAAAALGWHIVNEIRKVFKPDVRASDLSEIKDSLKDLTKEVVDLRVHVAKLNGKPKGS